MPKAPTSMQIPQSVIQLLPLALTPLAALVPNGIQRGIVLGLAGLYFGGFVVLPNIPSVRMKKLEKHINETVELHAIAIREVDTNPRFVTETSLRLAQIRISESVLRSRMLGARDITWTEYIEHIRCLSFHIGECQREVRDVRTAILTTLESNRQRRYKEDIAQRRTTLDTVFQRGSGRIQKYPTGIV
ncbi:hypothetical protein DFH07DRAFT_796723 [Mycena maculata]|uniref:Uncharacterized protein n=1 Tax=Mycena maculata TaxID=230809 RepID=A0AAD7NWG5_9AGAR|nr:hypothetical protein DFH07DRAFT_796723 [Mycena maculata]